RDPELGRGAELRGVEAGRDDADHGADVAAQGDGPADDARVAPEASRPQGMAQDRDPFAAGAILVGAERAAALDPGAEETEVGRGDLAGPKLLGEPASRVVDDVRPVGGDVLDDAFLFAPVLELRGR